MDPDDEVQGSPARGAGGVGGGAGGRWAGAAGAGGGRFVNSEEEFPGVCILKSSLSSGLIL
jgi:hypothetical protein